MPSVRTEKGCIERFSYGACPRSACLASNQAVGGEEGERVAGRWTWLIGSREIACGREKWQDVGCFRQGRRRRLIALCGDGDEDKTGNEGGVLAGWCSLAAEQRATWDARGGIYRR